MSNIVFYCSFVNRKIGIFALLIVAAMVLLGGCANVDAGGGGNIVQGTGPMVSRSFQVDDFAELEVGGGSSFTVIFRQSDNISVTIEMQENLFDFHEVSVRHGSLSVARATRDRIVYYYYRPRVYINAPFLTAINVNGALHAEDWDAIATQNFSIVSNGFVAISAPLEVDTLELDLSGASELEFWGDAHTVIITKNGAGSIIAGGLQTTEAEINLNGAGEVIIAVSDNLDATLEGVGNIRYIGNPIVTQNIGRTAIGSISRVDQD